MTLIDGFGENQRIGVGDVVTQTIDDVGESVGKLDFGDELEEGIIEVATETHFKKTVEAVVEQVPPLFHGEVNHGVHTSHHVWTIVVEAFSGKFDVKRNRNVGGFHVLVLAIVVQMIDEGDVLGAEVHGRNDA